MKLISLHTNGNASDAEDKTTLAMAKSWLIRVAEAVH